jgi:hypothetical protein
MFGRPTSWARAGSARIESPAIASRNPAAPPPSPPSGGCAWARGPLPWRGSAAAPQASRPGREWRDRTSAGRGPAPPRPPHRQASSLTRHRHRSRQRRAPSQAAGAAHRSETLGSDRAATLRRRRGSRARDREMEREREAQQPRGRSSGSSRMRDRIRPGHPLSGTLRPDLPRPPFPLEPPHPGRLA